MHWKGWYWSWSSNTLATWWEEPTYWSYDVGKYWRKKEKGLAEDEMVREHPWLNGHKFEQTSGDSKGQRSLACVLRFMGLQRVRHDLVAEQQQNCIPGSSLLWDMWRFVCTAYFFLHVILLLNIFCSFFLGGGEGRVWTQVLNFNTVDLSVLSIMVCTP